jgi:hypothetical protein
MFIFFLNQGTSPLLYKKNDNEQMVKLNARYQELQFIGLKGYSRKISTIH